MKKYRLEQPSNLKKYARYGLFFALWNFIGYQLYNAVSNTYREKYPDFDQWSSSQKALSFMRGGEGEINIKRIQGFSLKDDSVVKISEMHKLEKDCKIESDPEEMKI